MPSSRPSREPDRLDHTCSERELRGRDTASEIPTGDIVLQRRDVEQDEAWPSAVRHGPLASFGTIYETPDGRRCIVTFANRGADTLSPVRNGRGELWVGLLLAGD